MTKPYKLMKVAEGQYNIRNLVDDTLTGTILHESDEWHVAVFGIHAALASKDKAFGFVRGVYAMESPAMPWEKATKTTAELELVIGKLQDLKDDLGTLKTNILTSTERLYV